MIGTVKDKTKKVAWNIINVNKLTELWNSGASAALISDQIPDSTRNAIIGKAHRLGLPLRKRNPQTNDPNRIVKPKVQRRAKMAIKPRVVEAPPVESKPPSGELVPFMKAGSKTCRSIEGYAEQNGHMLAMFCPNPTPSDQSFCFYHHSIYYQKDDRR